MSRQEGRVVVASAPFNPGKKEALMRNGVIVTARPISLLLYANEAIPAYAFF